MRKPLHWLMETCSLSCFFMVSVLSYHLISVADELGGLYGVTTQHVKSLNKQTKDSDRQMFKPFVMRIRGD